MIGLCRKLSFICVSAEGSYIVGSSLVCCYFKRIFVALISALVTIGMLSSSFWLAVILFLEPPKLGNLRLIYAKNCD